MGKIEIQVQCAACGHASIKSYQWLRQKHLPCPECGRDFTVTNSHIAIVENRMQEALKEFDNIYGTRRITLKI